MIGIGIVGLLVGLISSFFGVGGGVLIIPALTFLLPQFPHAVIIACSLFTICINGLINSFYFYRSGLRPNLKIILMLGFFMILGSLTGTRLAVSLPEDMLKKGFAILLFIVFLKLSLKKNKTSEEEQTTFKLNTQITIMLITFGFLAGLLAGLTGVGGGIVVVPLLLSVFKLPQKNISSYSNPVMTMATFAASISYLLTPVNSFVPLPAPYDYFQIGHVNLLAVSLLIGASLLSAPIGVRLSQVISPQKSKFAFALLILFMAIKMSLS